MKNIIRFIKGIVIGVANIIPGVSGGTMALMLNIYEPLIEGLHNISFNTLKTVIFALSFKRVHVNNLKLEMKKINFGLLFVVIAGAGFAILAFSGLMTFLIESYHSQTFGFFFGLIIISVAIPFKLIKKINVKVIISLVLAIVIIVGLTMLDTDERKIEKEEQKIILDENSEATETEEYDFFDYVLLALSGAVAVSTMILPGISGSFMMLLMGKYFMILEAVNNFDVVILSVFALGILFGLLSFSRLANYLLKKYHDITMGFLTGLVIGSLWSIWPFKAMHILSSGEVISLSNTLPQAFNMTVFVTIITAVVGGVLVLVMIKLDKKTI